MDTPNAKKGRSGRILLLAVLVVAAAVLVVYFGKLYPPTSTEDAAATIGAVKKYRVRQISENDVVLAGQEAERTEIQSAHLLDGAAGLQNLSARLAAITAELAEREGEPAAARLQRLDSEVQAASRFLENESELVENRAMAAMRAELELATRMMESRLAAFDGEELAARRKAAMKLAGDLDSLGARMESKAFRNLADELLAFRRNLDSRMPACGRATP